ncbi:MAG: ATP-binding protein [Sediminibacterium sp.]|nr:ATP-binding protein [Sediminibacterium sp.]
MESAHIINPTHRAKEEINAWQLPVKKALEIAVIPCCADFNHFSLDKINDLVLQNWRQNKTRKPLVIRGARQVGKTTVVNQFASMYEQYIYVNLELAEDKEPFEKFTSLETLITTLFFLKNKTLAKKSTTLLFIDEIQAVPKALNILRYFYELAPEISVIAAGSMLETLFNKHISFPIGRVEYKVIRPVSFPEFLSAIGETAALEQINQVPIAAFAHTKLLRLFHTYALIGGMPEIVQQYATHRDLVALTPIYDSLISGYMEDVEKYAKSNAQILHLRHCIQSSFAQAGKRIKFEGFGNSSYKSREMGESLRTLEKALLLQLIYPCTTATLPMIPDIKKSPRLQILDTGLLNYIVGIQKVIISTDNLNNIYQGTLIEHLIGQELLAFQFNALSTLHFWVREKKESTAEVDYLFPYDGLVIPIEVKSGATGTLKSLHSFMELAPHDIAIRLYAGAFSISDAITQKGKSYKIINLPYYLGSQIEKYIAWFIQSKKVAK